VGVVLSMNGGASWTEVNEGLSWPFAWPIEIDAKSPNLVYVGTPGTGYHRRQF